MQEGEREREQKSFLPVSRWPYERNITGTSIQFIRPLLLLYVPNDDDDLFSALLTE